MTTALKDHSLRYLSDPILRAKAAPVGEVTPDIKELMEEMLERMYEENGGGLAAPQIGISKRVIVLDWSFKDPTTRPLMMADPEIVWASEEKVSMEERCLSVPDLSPEIERPKQVKVKYKDENNQVQEMHADGIVARCLQHEIDHLDGILNIDYLSPLRKKMAIKKIQRYLAWRKNPVDLHA